MGWFGVVRGHPSLSATSPFDRASLIETIVCLVPFMRYSLRQVHHRSILLPRLCLEPQRRGFHGRISVKFCMEVRGWSRYIAVKKYCRKVNPLGRVHERTDDRQTDRQTIDGFAIAKTRLSRVYSQRGTVGQRRSMSSVCSRGNR